MTEGSDFRSGFVTLVGRPNVGKSSLLNRLVGQKISITSQRPQTTRHRILGIKTTDLAQLVYVDTPGIHVGGDGRAINRYMKRAATASLEGVDCVVLVIAASGWRAEDAAALELARRQTCPVILAINKIDRLPEQTRLLALIAESQTRMPFTDIVPVSARSGANIERLEQAILGHLPTHPAYFEADQVSDRSDRFMAAELVREQVFRSFGEEVPYAVAVEISEFRQEPKLIRVEAIIWVEKEGQKAILIGKGGQRLKEIGRRARLAMQKSFACKVYLGLWVKVREGWSDDARALRSLGYTEDS